MTERAISSRRQRTLLEMREHTPALGPITAGAPSWALRVFTLSNGGREFHFATRADAERAFDVLHREMESPSSDGPPIIAFEALFDVRGAVDVRDVRAVEVQSLDGADSQRAFLLARKGKAGV